MVKDELADEFSHARNDAGFPEVQHIHTVCKHIHQTQMSAWLVTYISGQGHNYKS